MKITNPFVLLGLLIVGTTVVLATIDNTKKSTPPKTVIVQSTATTTTTVAIAQNDSNAEIVKALEALAARDRKWNDAVDLAGRTSRIALPPVIKDMQEQLRDNESVSLPKCLDAAKPYWLENQREVIAAYLDFMSSDVKSSESHFSDARRAARNYQMVLDACKPQKR